MKRNRASIKQEVEELRSKGMLIPQIARKMNIPKKDVTEMIYDDPIKTRTSFAGTFRDHRL